MPVLSIILIVCILHKSVVLEDTDPVFVFFHLFFDIGRIRWGDELLDCDRMGVEVLQSDVGEERDISILVE